VDRDREEKGGAETETNRRSSKEKEGDLELVMPAAVGQTQQNSEALLIQNKPLGCLRVLNS
jgi:hypothetical protein